MGDFAKVGPVSKMVKGATGPQKESKKEEENGKIINLFRCNWIIPWFAKLAKHKTENGSAEKLQKAP